jgi:hypothetical protein
MKEMPEKLQTSTQAGIRLAAGEQFHFEVAPGEA